MKLLASLLLIFYQNIDILKLDIDNFYNVMNLKKIPELKCDIRAVYPDGWSTPPKFVDKRHSTRHEFHVALKTIARGNSLLCL